MSSALQYRLASGEDFRFIRRAFLDSYCSAHAAGLISMRSWSRVMSAEWEAILERPGTKVFVAYHPEEKDANTDLYGFLAVETSYTSKGEPMPFVIYAYVKHRFRKKYGILRGLFAAANISLDDEFHYGCKTAEVKNKQHTQWKPMYLRFPPPEGENNE